MRSSRSSAPSARVSFVFFYEGCFLFRFGHKSAVEITPRAFCPSEAARAAARRRWHRRSHGFGESFDCRTDGRCRLSGRSDVSRQNSKLAIAFEARVQKSLFVFESLDAPAEIAGCLHELIDGVSTKSEHHAGL
jgi:hypothetical protein